LAFVAKGATQLATCQDSPITITRFYLGLIGMDVVRKTKVWL